MTRHVLLFAILCASSAAAPLSITTTSLPGGKVGAAYRATLSASGGEKPYTWSVVAGSLPDGLSLDPGSGAISGTPTTAGTSLFAVRVTDSSRNTDQQGLSIRIDPAPLTVTTTSLPGGTVGAAYSATLAASGGTGGYTWAVSAGGLPAGLTLDPFAGTISGTPSAAGTSNFTAQVTDSSATSASRSLAIAIAAPALVITTASVPNGTVGTAYSAALAASGGTGGYRWSLASGTLPAGLSLDPSGAIGGTPTTAGTSNFTAQVTDSSNTKATHAYAIAVAAPALVITTDSLPNGTVGAGYSASLAASGGTGGYTWSVSSGSLPAGLSLSPGGAITGTPTAAGTSNLTLQVKDSSNTTATKTLSLKVNPPTLTITTTSLPPGTVGAAYSASLTATGGVGGNVWSIVAGALPLGLTLSADGTITGKPLLSGSSNFTAQVRDAGGAVATQALSITVGVNPPVITTQSLPAAEQGVAYSQTLAASGGAGGYKWAVSDGALPAGLSMDAGGRISGTPTGTTSTFTAQVTDSAGATASKSFTLTVAPTVTFTGSTTLPSGALGVAYTANVAVSGGQTPYVIAVINGQFPPGLSLNGTTGDITGRPTQAGTFQFTLRARDAAGASVESPFTITIAAGLTITTAPALPGGSIGVPYQATLAAAGGAPPYTWSATAGALPAGISLSADGKIAGMPGAAGSFAFTAQVTDAGGAHVTKDFTMTIAAGLSITTAPDLPPAVPGGAYTTPLAAAGGRSPYTWSISAGSLPAGILLDSGTGVLSGTTSALGTYKFTVVVTDSDNVKAQKDLTLVVAPGLSFTTPASLPEAVAGTAYSFTLKASGGQAPYSWRVTDGALPGGLALNGATGVISGTPTSAGTFNFTVEVSDAGNLKGSRVHTLVVALPSGLALTISGVPASLGPLQQPALSLTLASPYPVAITGRLNLVFSPAGGMPDDPSVQFSTGGRQANFTIPANTTRASFTVPQLAVQTGSVQGKIEFTVDALQAGSSSLAAPSAPIGAITVTPAAASIRSVTVSRTSSGFQVLVVGLSDTRELVNATVRFVPASGTNLDTAQVSVPLSDAAKAWFASSPSNQYGGQFTVTLPFTIQGNVSLSSVAVTLANSVGASTEVSAPY